MDSATRDHYRRTVETIARRSPLAESEVARQAIGLAQASTGTSDERTQHVGFYLIDQGLPQLERAAQVKGSIVGALRGPSGRFPLLIYLGGILLLATIGTGGLLARVAADGEHRGILILVGILAALVYQPTGRGAGQLAGDPAGHAAPSAPHGLLRGNPGASTHPGRDSHHAVQRCGYCRPG